MKQARRFREQKSAILRRFSPRISNGTPEGPTFLSGRKGQKPWGIEASSMAFWLSASSRIVLNSSYQGPMPPPMPNSEEFKPVTRSDNALVFQSRRFLEMCRGYGLPQEIVKPYTPEQNGMIGRFFRRLKERCVWLRDHQSFEEARWEIGRWLLSYSPKTGPGSKVIG